jgi:hypothetical protein
VIRFAVLGQMILGDFRERTRRYSFIWTMIGTTFFGYLVITGQYTMVFNGFQPIVNSAWVGTLMAMFCTILLTIVGFYLISNTIKRDIREGVGQILASTPVSNLTYLLGKLASNFLVLVACTSILIVTAVVMQLLSSFSGEFSPTALLTPFAVITLPLLALVAGLAVVFESSRWLRGTFGNVLYLFIFEAAIVSALVAEQPLLDFIGSHRFTTSVEQTILAAYPGSEIGVQVGFVRIFEDMVQQSAVVFNWPGIDWSFEMFWPRLGYVGVGLALVILTSLRFNRFDPALVKLRVGKRKKKSRMATEMQSQRTLSVIGFHQIVPAVSDFSMYRMVFAELRVMLKGFHWVWYLIAVGLSIAQLATPLEITLKFLLPAALIWPLPIWSAMGTRNKRYNTEALLYSSVHPLKRQLTACWLGGSAITLLAVAGTIFRFTAMGQIAQAGALLAGAVFVPTAALALGTLTGTKKFFEVSYLLIWYVGLVDRLWALDFVGVTDRALSRGVPWVFLGGTCILLTAAVLSERTRLQVS